MKVVILAGGFGTRITEESVYKPKPMIEIGGHPIIWHIMKYYSCFGMKDFIICAGYRAYAIKEYFANYHVHRADISVSLSNGHIDIIQSNTEDWKVTIVDTGYETMTGGRLKRIETFIGIDDQFCMTYGDGLSNVDISKLIDQHNQAGVSATLTAIRPPTRFGSLEIDDNNVVTSFIEKPERAALVNGGFFVLNKDVFNYLEDDSTIWERSPLQSLAQDGKLSAYIHDGFWQPMDTIREKIYLEELWGSGEAPWKIWK